MPLKRFAFEMFVEKDKTIFFPKQHFDSITPPTTEQKQTALERVNLEGVFYEHHQTVNGFAHIGIAASNSQAAVRTFFNQ